MHELSIAQDVVGTALEEARRNGASRVTSIHLRVGVLRGVEPENLRFLLPLVAKGTAAEGVALEIEVEHLAWLCRACGKGGESEGLIVECPGCRSAGLELSGGDSLRLTSIDVE